MVVDVADVVADVSCLQVVRAGPRNLLGDMT
jgi:hypothetical protein